jgi:small GTP-binding protein
MNFFLYFKSKLKNMPPRQNLCILGLDRAGKTVLKNYLLSGETDKIFRPTLAFDVSKYSHQNLFYSVMDFPGQKAFRKSWPMQYKYAKILLYLVDANDPERFEESKAEFDNMLTSPLLKNVPLIVIITKVDMPDAKKNAEKAKKLFDLGNVQDRAVFSLNTSIKDTPTLDEVNQTMMMVVRNLVMPN